MSLLSLSSRKQSNCFILFDLFSHFSFFCSAIAYMSLVDMKFPGSCSWVSAYSTALSLLEDYISESATSFVPPDFPPTPVNMHFCFSVSFAHKTCDNFVLSAFVFHLVILFHWTWNSRTHELSVHYYHLFWSTR